MAASANNALVGAIRVEASLDAGKFVDGAQKIIKQSKTTEAAVKSSFAGIGTAIKAGIAGFVGALSVGSLLAVGKAALEYAGHLGELAETLGVTTKDLQVFSYAAGQVGVSQEALQNSLQKLTITLGQMKAGAEAPRKALDALKNGLADQVAAAPDTGAAFKLIAGAMQGVTDRTQRAAVEVALFKKSGAGIDNLLSGAEGNLNDFADAAQRLGIVLSDEQIKNADKTADKLEQLKTVLSAQVAGIVADNAQAIYKLADSIGYLVSQIPGAINHLKSLYSEFLNFSANVTEKVDQAVMSPINRFNPLVSWMRDPQMHANRLANIADDRKQAGDLRRDILGDRIASTIQGRARAIPAGRDIGKFLATPKQSKKGPEDTSADTEAEFARELMQADQAILQAKQQLAGTSEERAQLAVQMIQMDHDMQAFDINDRVRKAQKDAADKKITQSALRDAEIQADKLRAANDETTQIKLRAFVEEQLTKAEQANFEIADQRLKFTQDALHTADQLATTAEDHRRIQLQILDSEIEQQRLELEHQKQLAIRNGATSEEIKVIQDRINNLPSQRAQGAAVINQNTMNPLEKWLHDIPKTSAEMTAALQSIEVNGLDSLIDKIDATGDAFRHLGRTSLEEGQQIATMFIQLALRMLVLKAIAGIAGNGFNYSSVANPTLPLGGGSPLPEFGPASAISIPGLASGGSFMVGGRGGTDMNLLSINGIPRARVSGSEMVTVGAANDGGMPPPIQIVTHIDATGADPAELSRVRAAVEQMNASMPARVVQAYYDAVSRNVIR